ncbi:hypothetical protein GCM10011348_39770 [Marinobacterium nitratireducens]|uniref:Uncharacterized protein n=1 Tax=Marinobacterium nitratireducens TaxID=518897 RepID=A0A917ZPU0_9GAMM|nr:DUF6635 family protein [Marinobacterium nitratireducens]GGO87181.1 hypothetical protein GCM10011348_39770 [Marinobacterium nitratireducens]
MYREGYQDLSDVEVENLARHEPSADDQARVEAAIDRAIGRYMDARQRRVDPFVRRHFSFRGSLRLHAQALGWDLVRIPLNIAWSLPRFVIAVLGLLAGICGLRTVAAKLAQVPPGLITSLDREIGRLVVTELLELPCDAADSRARDALMAEILADPFLQDLIDARLGGLAGRQADTDFRRRLDLRLAEYGASRTGTSELAGNLMVVLSSQLALGQTAWGSFGAGSAIAASVAKSTAVAGFWLGPVVGSWFYAMVPVVPSTTTVLVSVAGVAMALSVVATFIGTVADPVQARLGWHQRRLRKLLGAVQQDLSRDGPGDFQLREKYVGRVFDVLDYLAAAGRSL